jgi:hypothetical protein
MILSPTSFKPTELAENKILGGLCELCEKYKGNYLFYPASSIQYPVSWVLWDKRSFSVVGSKFRVQGSKLKNRYNP